MYKLTVGILAQRKSWSCKSTRKFFLSLPLLFGLTLCNTFSVRRTEGKGWKIKTLDYLRYKSPKIRQKMIAMVAQFAQFAERAGLLLAGILEEQSSHGLRSFTALKFRPFVNSRLK